LRDERQFGIQARLLDRLWGELQGPEHLEDNSGIVGGAPRTSDALLN